ncbi:MAG: hypothetical protein ACKO9Q_09195 [Pirellula sp.]
MGWKVSETKATNKHGTHELVVITQPSLGIHIDMGDAKYDWEIRPMEDSVGPDTPAPAPGEAYSRLDDFIVNFPQRYPWPFSYQLDVRVQPDHKDLLVAELWLSVQTSMLECNPQLCLVPKDPKAPWTCHPQFICSADRRLALVVHPLDIPDSKLHASRSGSVERLDLFGQFMEKGVIRRGRLLLVASNTSISEKRMKDMCSIFAASSLPLTA